MSVFLNNNFLLNSRGLTLLDGGGLTWSINKNTNAITATGTGGGVLSSVGFADTSTTAIYAVTNSPLTANGTIDITLKVQNAALVFAGPATGVAAQPAFRALQATDIPTLAYVTSIGSSNLSVGGTAAVPTVNLSSTQVINIGLGGTALQSATTADSIQGAGTVASPIELVGDSAAPGNSKYYGTNGAGTRGWYTSATVPTAANPSATIGLVAVNGATGNWMDAGSAPALSQAISPSWTGTHTWAKGVAGGYIQSMQNTTTGTTSYAMWRLLNDSAHNFNLIITASTWSGAVLTSGPSGEQCLLYTDQNIPITIGNNDTARIIVGIGGAVTVTGNFAVNNVSPPAQPTGYGTPTGNALTSSFAAGSISLPNLAAEVAQLVLDLKKYGIIGA